jgi:hypothetical protein
MVETGGQFLILDSKSIYVFESVLHPSPFLRALPHLLSPSDKVVFGTYGSHQSVLDFWSRHCLPRDPIIDAWDNAAKSHKDNEQCSNPMGCGIPAEPKLLFELADIAGTLDQPYELCDHLGAYSADKALVSFHDAFKSDPCHVSGDIPKEKADRFAEQIGIPYRIAPEYEVYSFWKTKDA